MKKVVAKKKLALGQTTVRVLTPAEVTQAVGGVPCSNKRSGCGASGIDTVFGCVG